MNDSIQQAIAAHEAEALALKESRAKAMDAYEAELALAAATEDATSKAVVAGTKSERAGRLAGDAADDIIDFGNAMRDAAGEADALQSSLDLLLNPFLDVHEATSNYEEAVDDMTTAIMGGQEVIDMRAEAIEKAMEGDQEAANMLNFYADAQAAANKTLDLSVPAGRENAAVIRDQVTSITDLATANLTAGKSHEEVAAAAETTSESCQSDGGVLHIERSGGHRRTAGRELHQHPRVDPGVDLHGVLAAQPDRLVAERQ